MADPAALAGQLRDLHAGPELLVLPNAWDAASARLVEESSFPAVATSSAACARALGRSDGEAMTPDEAFGAVARIAAAVSVPVTADMESGYGLPATEFVERLLGAGAVGCNLEDTDHAAGHQTLVEAAAQADRLAAVKEAARAAGVDIVLNARVDTFARKVDNALDEGLARGRRYVEAGADCVYPITASEESDIAALVQGIDAPVNILFRPGSPTLDALRSLGVRRVSMGSGLHTIAMDAARAFVADLR